MIDIVEKSSDYVVICKPAGIPSQSDPSGDKDAMTMCAEMLHGMNEKDGLYLIHRLDRVVGGLLVFARNKSAAADLSLQVAERKLTKRYYAVVEGKAEGGLLFDYIYKDAALGKAFVTDRKRSGVKSAELEYTPLDSVELEGRILTLVKINLKTGRFHQIRAQFSSRGMSLIGDKKYGSRDFKAKMPSLFAAELSFTNNGKEVSVSRLPNISEYPWSLFNEEKYR